MNAKDFKKHIEEIKKHWFKSFLVLFYRK
jgi:hypothetical protein